MTATKRIPRTRLTCLFDPDQEPVAEIAPGEVVVFETQDAHGGRVETQEDALNLVLSVAEVNPATGPVVVLGAQPGDTLAVRIVEIRLGPVGHARVRLGRGVLRAELAEPAAGLMPIHDGLIHFNERVRLPVRPMVGVVGTAPGHGQVPAYHPGPHGGNLDMNAVSPGATVYLPVAVPGALLALGDVHASMGDGELPGSAIEIAADVVVQTELHHGLGWQRPVIETADAWCTCANAATLWEAIHLASHDMALLLSRNLDLTYGESYMLIGAAGDARVGQAADVGVDMTAYVRIDKSILPRAM